MISHLSLTKTATLSDSISLQTNDAGFEFLVIQHDKLNATFSLHGGHLIHFQVKNQAPVIWLSKTAIFNPSKAIRGGVPICWPWFGAADASLGDNLPSHGFARTSKWSVGEITESDAGVELELKLTDNTETLKIWPYAFELTLKATLSDTLNLQLITQNKGSTPFTYRSALHTYLNIGTPASVNVSGLNEQFYNSLNQGALETGDTTLLIDRAIDCIYKKSASNIVLSDSELQRTLTITNKGNDSEVLWSPWIEGAKAFADMPDDGYQTMLCIESTITDKAGQTVGIGQKHTISTLIK